MKKSEAMDRLRNGYGDVEAARFIIDYFHRRMGLEPEDEALYKFIRRHSGLAKDEWDDLVKKALSND